jgi:hypothetical protein
MDWPSKRPRDIDGRVEWCLDAVLYAEMMASRHPNSLIYWLRIADMWRALAKSYREWPNEAGPP